MQYFTCISNHIPHYNLTYKPPILTQQITADFQLSQKAWKQLSGQINEMVETKKLLKKQYREHTRN